MEICRPVARLENDKFRMRLCVLTDIFGHLNKLNLLLQGRAKLLCNLYEAVKGFEVKVALFMRKTAIFCTSTSQENSVEKTQNVAQTQHLYLPMCLPAWRLHSMGDSLTSLQSTTFAVSLQALSQRSQLFAQSCRKRLPSTRQKCRTISSTSRWCQD